MKLVGALFFCFVWLFIKRDEMRRSRTKNKSVRPYQMHNISRACLLLNVDVCACVYVCVRVHICVCVLYARMTDGSGECTYIRHTPDMNTRTHTHTHTPQCILYLTRLPFKRCHMCGALGKPCTLPKKNMLFYC